MLASRLAPHALAFGLAAAITIGVPATSVAATVSVEPKCYLNNGAQGTPPIPFTTAGLAAGQTGTATLTGPGVSSAPAPLAPADGAGNAQGTIRWTTTFAAMVPMRDVAATLTVADAATGAPLASTPVTVGNAGLKIGSGKLKEVSKNVNWEASGLFAVTGKKVYYAHFFKQKDVKKANPKPVGSMKLGAASGACGYLKAKRPLAPFKRSGLYAVGVQSSKKYDNTAPTLTAVIQIVKRFK